MSVVTPVVTPVVTSVGCDYALTDFYTCGQASSFLVTTADWDMYLCADCHAQWNA